MPLQAAAEGKPEWWRGVWKDQEASGLSVRQFCADRGLSASQFYYWRRRLIELGGQGSLAKGDRGIETPSFVELDLATPDTAPVSSPVEIRLDLGAGWILQIRRG
jgi:transposase-like protein